MFEKLLSAFRKPAPSGHVQLLKLRPGDRVFFVTEKHLTRDQRANLDKEIKAFLASSRQVFVVSGLGKCDIKIVKDARQ